MDLSQFENRAKSAEDIIEQLSKKLAQLEQTILNKSFSDIKIAPTTTQCVNENTKTVPLETHEAVLKENEKLKTDIEKLNYRINHLLRNMK